MVAPNSRFDFDRAKQRLAELRDALDNSAELTPEQAEQALRERAEAYAVAPDRGLLASEQLELLTFHLGDELYALESRFVSEVLRAPVITDVPGTPSSLLGVTNLRGEILAVLALAQVLGTTSNGECPWVLVLGHEHPELGIAAHAVDEVAAVRTDAVLAATQTNSEIGRNLIRGVTADAVIVLEGQAILDDPSLHIDIPDS